MTTTNYMFQAKATSTSLIRSSFVKNGMNKRNFVHCLTVCFVQFDTHIYIKYPFFCCCTYRVGFFIQTPGALNYGLFSIGLSRNPGVFITNPTA